jgi:(2S)-methylsuccinyl-CoA dehydrogenase
MLEYGEHGPFEAMLATGYIADAIFDIWTRVNTREDAWGVAPGALDATRAFVASHRSADFLEALATEVERHGSGPAHLSEDFDLVRETFRRFAEDRIRPVAESVHRENLDIPEEVIAGLAEIGGFGLSVPEEFGGYASGDENDYLGMVVATEELAWGSLGLGGSLITRPEIITRAIVRGGTDEQKQRWLPRIATGELMAGIMVTEPDYGSDVAGVKVSATPTDGGYLINGVKTWCTFAGRANVAMLLARTDPDRSAGHRGLSVFVVDKEPAPGHAFSFTQEGGGTMEGRAIDTLGYRGMHSYEVAFSDWFVPAENLIGEESGLGKGFYLQMEGFENGRLQTAARAVGLMEAAFEAGLRYAQDRVVFGRSVSEYQLSRAKLARMAFLIQAGRQFGYHVAELMGRGVDGQGLRVPGGRVGHPRGDAAARRHGLRRGVRGVALLRRRPGALDLRGRRRDAVPAGDRPAPRRGRPARHRRLTSPPPLRRSGRPRSG